MEKTPHRLVRTKPRRLLVNTKVAAERSFAERHRDEIVAGGAARAALARVMDNPEERVLEILESEANDA